MADAVEELAGDHVGVVILHGFIKKSQKVPSDDLHTAIGRLTQLHAARHR